MAKVQYYITYFFIGIVVLACVIGMFSCNPQKGAVKKLATIDSRHKQVVDGYFAMTRPCTDSVDVRVVYKEGRTVTDTMVLIEYETLNDTVTRYITKTVTKVQRDTIFSTKYEKQTDKSKLGELQAINQQLRDERDAARISEAKKQKALLISIWGNVAFLACIVLWVIKKKFWK